MVHHGLLFAFATGSFRWNRFRALSSLATAQKLQLSCGRLPWASRHQTSGFWLWFLVVSMFSCLTCPQWVNKPQQAFMQLKSAVASLCSSVCRNAHGLQTCMCKDWRATVPGPGSTACSAFTALCFLCFSCSDLRVCKTCLPIVTQTFWDSQNNLDFRIYITQLQPIEIKSTPGGQRRHHVNVYSWWHFVLIWCEHCVELRYAV